MKKHKVLIMRCGVYNSDTIRSIVKEGMQELGVTPAGRVLLKPNVVIAHPELFPHAFTRKEFLDGVIAATKDRAAVLEELAVGERAGLTLPTRWTFANAGYLEIIKKHKIKVHYFDEARQVPVALKAQARLRDRIYVPKPVAKADFLINLPKFKAHPWCRLTLSLKNFIGIQDDRHRLIDHNQFLEHKIADLQEVIAPKFIAVDAIVAGQKMMLTPTPFDMGAIVMGVNSCAVDTVCCHMVHVEPKSVIHLRIASERGLGPMNLDDIDVGGDFPLDAVRANTRNFEFCMERIDRYFKDGNLSCTVGTFPESHSVDYCWGGCPGALQEAMHINRANYPDVDRQMRKIRYVVGKVEGPLLLEQDEQVIFAGDCTSWEGEIDGQTVKIENKYKTKEHVDESKAPSNDMLLKTFQTLWNCFRRRNRASSMPEVVRCQSATRSTTCPPRAGSGTRTLIQKLPCHSMQLTGACEPAVSFTTCSAELSRDDPIGRFAKLREATAASAAELERGEEPIANATAAKAPLRAPDSPPRPTTK